MLTLFVQVDDDGESYWVFESRDVRLYTIHRVNRVPMNVLYSPLGLPTLLTPSKSASNSIRWLNSTAL